MVPETVEIVQSTYLLTNIPGLHSLITWRNYNERAVVEQRIEELEQLSAGQTALNHLGGSHLLGSPIRSATPSGASCPPRGGSPSPNGRTRMFQVSVRFTRCSGYFRVYVAKAEHREGLVPSALKTLADSVLRGPPARAT